MKRNSFDKGSLLFKNLIRIGYYLGGFASAMIGGMFLSDYNFPEWTNALGKFFFVLYLAFGMLLCYLYEIPMFNPSVSSLFEKNYKIGIFDFIAPAIFVFIILVIPV